MKYRIGVALLSVIAAPGAASAATPKEIVKKATDQQAFRAKGIEMRMLMRLRNERGEVRTRELFARSLRSGGRSRTLLRFLKPADVAGTSFLFIERKDRDDDQYMYLPALKIVRRIVGSQKNARFMGSQLTYADMEWRSLEDATYVQRGDKTIGADPCYVIDAKPKKQDSYSRLRVWIRKKDTVMLRLHFFDKRGKLLKALYVKKLERVGGMKMATVLKIKNKQTGDATQIEIRQIKTRDDLKEDQFSVRALKKR